MVQLFILLKLKIVMTHLKYKKKYNRKNRQRLQKKLKYLSNFWRTLEMPLINCEINFDLN